jgi:hypothetical protein
LLSNITIATRGLEEPFIQLCCCVSFLVVAEIDLGDTSLSDILSRDFSLCGILRTIVPGPKPPSAKQLLRKTAVTMVTSGFGLYHGLWLDDAPTKHICIILTPWAMTCALGFVEILQVHE